MNESEPLSDSSIAVARAFLHAIMWGEHHTVWSLLGPAAREHVLGSATRRGMDSVAASRARLGTWGTEEADQFLTALVHGLRVDLSGADLELIEVVDEPELLDDGALRYRLESKTLLPPILTRGANWAAGAVVIDQPGGVAENMEWKVRKLEPRPPAGP